MSESQTPTRTIDPKKERLRLTVRYFYDVQKLRIAAGNRTADPDSYKLVEDKKNPGKEKKVKKNVTKGQMEQALQAVVDSVRGSLANEEESSTKKERKAPATLEEEDRLYLTRQQHVLMNLEADTLQRVNQLLKGFPIAAWLLEQKGIGPTLAGVLISEIDIARADTSSALWAYCGLHTDPETGAAVRRQRGVKSNWNSFLKAKCVKVLAECFIKANSPWRSFYDSYKMRKKNELVQVCMLCNGEGKVSFQTDDVKEAIEKAAPGGKSTCSNCKGTGGPAPWGRSDAHRDLASKRYMVKQFLLALWLKWRELEGLPITPTYAEAMLGRKHGDHGGAGPALTKKGEPFRPAPRNGRRGREQHAYE